MPLSDGSRGAANCVAGAAASDVELRRLIRMMGETFRDDAPISAAKAATAILDAVRTGTWWILVCDDAQAVDAAVRANPEAVYAPDRPPLSLFGR